MIPRIKGKKQHTIAVTDVDEILNFQNDQVAWLTRLC